MGVKLYAVIALLILAGCGLGITPPEPITPPYPVDLEADIDKLLPVETVPDITQTITKEVTEGDLVSFPNLKAVDPDGDEITYTFTKPLNENGEWQTEQGDAGEYAINITASDGKNSVEKEILIIVREKENPPQLIVADTEVNEGETVVLEVEYAYFKTVPTITFEGWMTSETKKTSFDDAGEHKVRVTATAGKQTLTKEITIVVNNVNRPPVFVPEAFR